jgi:hypothetical protein
VVFITMLFFSFLFFENTHGLVAKWKKDVILARFT